jgi:hypothetical protein
MARLPWTKFQDFYLRVGFLKILGAVLDPNRRSVANDALARRLEQLLFSPAREHSVLWGQVVDRFPWFPDQFKDDKSKGLGRPRDVRPTVTEALLLLGDCPSQLHAITRKTSYKILDWGRNLQLLGAGNQITEKGLILRSMLPEEQYGEFLKGNPLSWNPFVLSPRERLFFLFHLSEVDHLTLELLDELCGKSDTKVIETSSAAEMTCRALFRVVNRVADRVSSADLPALRRARELASIMALELRLDDESMKGQSPRVRVPRPKKVLSYTAPWAHRHSVRRTTKNADHQTIPRFEQLVDLGLLRKPCSETMDSHAMWECRRHWRYERLPSCDAWVFERLRTLEGHGPWEWRGFAAAALASDIAGVRPSEGQPSSDVVASFLWTGYQKVRRQIGHTPFHSIALVAMIEAAVHGHAIEMRKFHELLMALKRQALLQDYVFFASGNEIDRMFVVIREGFVDHVRRLSPEHLALP